MENATQQSLDVLVGNANPPVSESLRVIIDCAVADRFRVKLNDYEYWDELADHANRHSFDVLIINLTQTIDRNRRGCSLGEITAANISRFRLAYDKPIIVLTSWDEPGLFARLESAGADAIIRMPFEIADIRSVLEKILPSK